MVRKDTGCCDKDIISIFQIPSLIVCFFICGKPRRKEMEIIINEQSCDDDNVVPEQFS